MTEGVYRLLKDGIQRASRSALVSLHNRYAPDAAGHRTRCFILGTGPSLDLASDIHLAALAKEWVWGVNTVLLYARLPFVPHFYCVAESTWLQNVAIPQLVATLPKLPVARFYAHHWPLLEPQLRGWIYVPYVSGSHIENGEFSGLGNELPYVTNGRSVVLMAVQLACWLGFSDIYLLGVDASTRGHAQGLTLDPGDDYRDTQGPFIRAALAAEATMANHGRRLVDLTVGGNLPISKGDIRSVLGAGERG